MRNELDQYSHDLSQRVERFAPRPTHAAFDDYYSDARHAVAHVRRGQGGIGGDRQGAQRDADRHDSRRRGFAGSRGPAQGVEENQGRADEFGLEGGHHGEEGPCGGAVAGKIRGRTHGRGGGGGSDLSLRRGDEIVFWGGRIGEIFPGAARGNDDRAAGGALAPGDPGQAV